MTADERTVVEWAIWRVRHCDLPADVQAACQRLSRTGEWPRPDEAGGYQPVRAHVTAFPKDESQPMRDRYASLPHVGAVVQDMVQAGDAYLLVHLDDH